MSLDESIRKLLDYVEILRGAEESLTSAASLEQLRERLRGILATLLSASDVRAGEESEESAWAHEQGKAVVLPVEGGGCRVVFPLRGLPQRESLLAESPMDAEQAATLARQVLDRLVRLAEWVARWIRERSEQGSARVLLDSILDSIPHAVVAVDASGRILVANANAEILFGVRRIDLLDEPLAAAMAEAPARALTEMLAAVRQDGRVHEREVEHRIGATSIQIGISGSPLGTPESPSSGAVFVCRDLRVTRELQKLRELDALKTEFVHTVSHELKTPLTAVLGSLELLLLDREKIRPEHRELVDLIDQGARRLKELIYDILSVSRLERGVVELNLQPVDVAKAVEGVTSRLSANARSRIRAAMGKRLPPAAADPAKLAEILENLVSNALKYSPEERKVDVRATAAGRMIRIEVRDRGMGIRPKDRKHLFEKFFRSQDARLAGKEGTGLGLAIARELARLHGGRLSFRSRVGKGTTFVLELPSWKGRRNGR